MKLVSSIPVYLQISDYYKHLIESGALKADEYLPSVREVSLLLGVNPNTVQRAFSILIDDGYVTPISGKGNRINEVEKNKEELTKLIQDITYQGYTLDEIRMEIDKLMKEEGKKKKWLKLEI